GLAVEPLVSATLIERFARGSLAHRRPGTILRFIAIAAVAGAPVAATVASLATVLVGPAGWHALGGLWLAWWFASLAGTVVVAPVLVCVVVFAGRFPTGTGNYSIEFLCAPVLLWAAFRQGRWTVSAAAALLCAMAVWGTTHGYGPFVRSGGVSILLVQGYTVVMAAMAAVVAAVVAEHRAAQAQLREMATTDPLPGLANYRRLLE